jgi:hypothetical protein
MITGCKTEESSFDIQQGKEISTKVLGGPYKHGRERERGREKKEHIMRNN